MRRWIIVLSLGVAACPAVAAAASRNTDTPLFQRLLGFLVPTVRTPTYRVVHRPHPRHEREHERTAAITPAHAPQPAAPAAEVLSPAEASVPMAPQAAPLPPERPVVAFAPAPLLEVVPDTIEPVAPSEPALAPKPERLPTRDSACNGGHRIVSAYYWEGHHTASGQPFNPHGMTAAHRTLPFGTHLTVTNPRTGRTVTVTVNDRGPYTHGVSLDLSLGAAQAIGMHGTGTVCILGL